MRIALVSREYPPFFGGGIGAYTVAWSRTLARAGHSIVVVTVSSDGTERRERDGQVEVVRLPFINGNDWSGPHPAIATPEAIAAFRTFSPVSVLSMQIERALPRLAEEFGLDVVEFPETGALGWFTLNARRNGLLWASGPAIVTAIHSPTEWISEWNRSPLRGRAELELAAMEEDCIRWSDGLTCPSNAVAEWSRRRWGLLPDAVTVIPYPLGELEAVAQRRTGVELGRNGSNGRILFVGRLEPRKGVDTLIKGFAHAVGDGLRLSLDLAGEDMPDPEHSGRFGARRLAELTSGLAKHIHAHGRIAPSRVAELQAAADIAVVPAPMDNFPFTCMEAMAHGRLVVAAAAGGMAEMIRDGEDGLLFAPGDESACAAALRRAATLDNDQASSLRRSAAARILELCGNDRVTRQRLAHYERAIAARCSPRAAGMAREWLIINQRDTPAGVIDRLRTAVSAAGADFAHGWIATSDRGVGAFSAPRPELLSLAGDPGPLVVTQEAAERPRVARLLSRAGPCARTASTQAVAITLLADGARGVVVPDAITTVPGTGLPTAEVELARIRSSRGWRLLQRVYDVLHILRGRGLRRP